MPTNDKSYLVEIHSGLKQALEKQSAALPEGLNKERFMQNCMSVLQDGRTDYSKCDPRTLVRTLLKGSMLGLDFSSNECYAVPFGNEVQFMTDYKGEIKLAKRYSSQKIRDIYAKIVREGDVFEEEIINGRQSINFKPQPFNNGDIIGVFAVCLYDDGSMIYDTMSKEDVEHVRNTYSKSANGKAWKESYGEMCKKTVLRRLCKMIDLNFDNAQQREAWDEGQDAQFGERKPEVEPATDVFPDEEPVIDAEAEEVEPAKA
jgi:recombination protein RecT